MDNMLAILRRRAGFATQEAFAAHLGIQRTAVARWEVGDRYPRPTMLPAIAKALNVTEGEVIASITASRREPKTTTN